MFDPQRPEVGWGNPPQVEKHFHFPVFAMFMKYRTWPYLHLRNFSNINKIVINGLGCSKSQKLIKVPPPPPPPPFIRHRRVYYDQLI